MEGTGDCATGVARSGYEDGELAAIIFGEVTHETSHEAGAKVFESESGSVKELKDGSFALERMKRSGKVDGIEH